MNTDSANPIVPATRSSAPIQPPPHPLDGKWHVYLQDKVYGPYTGHDLKGYAADGTIDPSTNVVRDGHDKWIKAADDPVLARLFVSDRTPAPPPNISAAPGATVVQVTNQIGPNPALAALEEGEFGPKSAGVALLLSILLCGAGQMYNGQVAKGILMLFGSILLWFVLMGWIIVIWSWIDAYQTAKKMNARYMRRLAAGLPI